MPFCAWQQHAPHGDRGPDILSHGAAAEDSCVDVERNLAGQPEVSHATGTHASGLWSLIGQGRIVCMFVVPHMIGTCACVLGTMNAVDV